MDIKHFFYPQKQQEYQDTKYNKNIELVKFGGALRLDMGDLTQSGEIIEQIWTKTFKKLIPKDFSPKSVLILGFGAGSVAKVITKKWPESKITGLEIDKTVIQIARKYFGIGEIKNLKILNQDAHEFIKKNKNHFDLVLVDCYLGDQFPKKLESLSFYKSLKKNSSLILINRLFWGDYQEPTLKFKDKLAQNFNVSTTRTPSNFLISIS